MVGARKRRRVVSEGEGHSADEEPTAKRRSPGWLGQTFSTLTSKVKGAFRTMKEWFTGEEEGEGEGTAPQQRSSLRENARLPVAGSEGSTLFHGDSVLQCGGGDVASPPLLSLMTSRHSSYRGLSDSDTVCSGRTPLLDQMERQRDRNQFSCLLRSWAAAHHSSFHGTTHPWEGSRKAGTTHRKLEPSVLSTHTQMPAPPLATPSAGLKLWSSVSVEERRPLPKPTAPSSVDKQTEEEGDNMFRNRVKNTAAAKQPYHLSPLSQRPEFERLQAKLKDLRMEVLEHRTDFAAQSDAYEKYAALARKKREELVDTLASKLYRVGLGEEGDKDEEEEEEELSVLLTQKQRQTAEEVWSRYGSGDQVMSSLPRLTVRRCDLMTLKGLEWLNDEVINFYMTLISDRSQQRGTPRRAHNMSTFFYPKLLTSGYSGVRRWTKKVDVFSFDVILVPVHLGMHWTLAVIDLKEKTVMYFDSMGGDNHACHSALRVWLVAEAKDKKGSVLDLAGWKTATPKDIPRQQNGSDCGVFTCMFARYYTSHKSFTFKQADMQDIRRRMVCEIVERRLF